MRGAGALLSGLGHAGLLGLAAVGPPFLWAPKDRPIPAVSITLVSVGEFAALLRPPLPAPPPEPEAAAPAPSVARTLPMPAPLVAAPVEELPPATSTLTPSFDPRAPLGIAEAPPPDGAPAASGALPGLATGPDAAPGPEVDAESLRLDHAARVQRAVELARVYPQVARDRGLEGRVLFQVVLAPDGRLLASQLLQSSGAMTLDRAALETVRKARFPPAPAGIEAERQSFTVEIVFRGSR